MPECPLACSSAAGMAILMARQLALAQGHPLLERLLELLVRDV
eukprot:CAMPEP_0171239056 /NCGR_PEP_ID=MMETSP0790-20130122/43783_1 /TAXON_ID=2925 /ORGANISM="Alexandrium catenella, Strain OF101" /LENGTH=42 /DNA_ID= /DNA_START= /DNA_END= /DNA_ORIENTATION=